MYFRIFPYDNLCCFSRFFSVKNTSYTKENYQDMPLENFQLTGILQGNLSILSFIMISSVPVVIKLLKVCLTHFSTNPFLVLLLNNSLTPPVRFNYINYLVDCILTMYLCIDRDIELEIIPETSSPPARSAACSNLCWQFIQEC